MELIAFIQVFNIIVIAIGTLLYMCCRSFSSSSPAADSDVADSAVPDSTAVADDDDSDIPPRREKYDVFISFRGEDTRLGFTSHLHAALLQKKIETYIDNRLQRGEEIRPALLEAIEKSTISVIIFSQNYASSAWCLDEVVHILDCKERYGQMVIPVFYDINPSHVRKQHGSYADAFAQLEKRFEDGIDKVHKWRDALTTAANLSGFDYSNKSGTEADLIQKVVDHIWIQLCRESSCDLNGFVGIESRIKQIELLLAIHSQDACITVGIWGMGGIGKTTLAETVFRKHSSKFEASCFLKNVTENSEQAGGLDLLEKTLLKEILKEEVLPVGSTLVRERLSRTKVLIVLDDVSSSMQMERLAGDRLRYGTGSRIIITTRDRGTLGQTVEEDNIYEVEVLKPDDALQLFCSRAFKNNSIRRTDYKESAEKVVHYARGVPLALTVLGSLFFNCKSKEDWEDEFNKLKRFPSESIQKVLRISYDRLETNEKEIFLDIACFCKGRPMDEVKRMLDVRGFFATAGIRILIDMSLISIDSKWGRETIGMHDLLQEMGRTIVQEQCIKDPCKRNRLFTNEDVYRALKSNTETSNVEAIFANWSKIQERPLHFKKMSNLIMLILDDIFACKFTASLDLPDSLRYLEWSGCPLKSLPSNICLENLVELHLPRSKVKELWKEEQILVNLQVIDMSNSYCLIEVPNLSGSLKIVEINLSACHSLVEIPSYFQLLDKLARLDLGVCTSLNYLPEMPGNITYLNLQCSGIKELPESVWSNENISYLNISRCEYLEKLPSNRCKLKYLEELNLSWCFKLENFPEILEPMEHLKSLNLSETAVKVLPSSIEFLPILKRIQLKGCYRLSSIPKSICKLKYLEELDLSRCSKLENFPEILEPMEQLKSLNLSGTAVKELPSSIEFLPALKNITLTSCKWLSSIPKSICKLKNLEELDLSRCSKLENFPEILEPMEHLKSLNLSGTTVKELPSSIEFLPALKNITLTSCKWLSSIPKSICKLKYLEELDLSRCCKLENFPEILEPMEHLKSLNLSGTAVKELPSSIEFLPALKNITLTNCKWLSSIPKSICKLKNLEELDLSRCCKLENFPEILEPMEHLKSLNLSGTAVKELPSSIEFLPALKNITLTSCKWLSSIPKSICKLKYLEELDLSRCSKLENFPEILEPMEHLKSLNLSGTAVKELPSSIEFLPALTNITLTSCKWLSSIPKSICKLKYLEELDLSRCSKLENFPEILEPMEHLKSLNLSGTAVKELPSSIEFLPALKNITLTSCKWLSSIPKSICKLKYLEELDLSRCSKLENFPEILEPMEHLKSLNLSGTAVKELPSSIEFLPALTNITLTSCKWLSSIPKSICKLKYLEELDLSRCSKLENFPEILEPMEHLKSLNLSGTSVKELPSSIDFLPALKKITLTSCKWLSSIPKSICKLKYLEELDLSRCSKLENFPEILEPMEHLKSLNLSGTAVKELPSSIEFLPALKNITLTSCKWLSSIPKSICKLKYLEELDLSRCSKLENFPEILEPMEHFKSLNLSGTAVKELPSSIEFLPALKKITLESCKWLSSIPKSICKLKYLKELDLSWCSKLKNFPEILEPMEHLKSLNLSQTAVKELPSSIEFFPILKRIQLKGCYSLSSIPKSICKLKYLEELDLSWCSKLENFPEILEPMEHLKSLNLSGTAVEQLYTSSIEFLPALKNIELEGCNKLFHVSQRAC